VDACAAEGFAACFGAADAFAAAAGFDEVLVVDFAAGFADDFAVSFAAGTFGSRDGVRAELTLTAASFFDFVFEFALTTSADFLDFPDVRALRTEPRAEVSFAIVRRV
jgi:hypothetical protein